MPDFIENNIGVFNRIVSLFQDEVEGNLDHEAKELNNRLERAIDLRAKTYSLQSQNTVNPIKYYTLKYRIKSVNSLKEKLVRKNDGFKIIEATEINVPDDVDKNRPLLIARLNQIPDIIGIRVVTELRHDCHKIIALLRGCLEDLDAIEIVLDKLDIENQPQPMKNGLSIFKIKGLFRNRYGFELQVKSKIEEAWGDMDHAIFYKDYSVTPVKNVTQVTMNNIGKLLEDIDELMLGLRKSDDQYQENLEQLTNLKSLNDELYPLLVEKLGTGFEIGKVASFLMTAKEKALENVPNPVKLEVLNCTFLDFIVNDEALKRYTAIRNKSFEMMVIELAYFNWCIQNGKVALTPDNYEQHLTHFLGILSSHIFKVIERENPPQAAELIDSGNLYEKVKAYSEYINGSEIYLSEKALILISKIEGNIEEFFQDKQDFYFQDSEDYLEFKTAFKVTYVVTSLGYNKELAVKNLVDEFKKKEEHLNATLDTIAYDFKEYQRKNERNTRADQKVGEVVKESVPTVQVTETVVNYLKSNVNA